MKKLLLVLGILTVASLGFADAKSDYENAVNLAREGKTTEAVQLLESVSKTKDKTYSAKAKYNLGFFYGQQNDIPNAKKYFESVWQDSGLVENEKIVATKILYDIAVQEQNFVSAEKYIKALDKLTNGENAEFTAIHIIENFRQKKDSDAIVRYNNAMKNKSEEYKATVNYNVGAYFASIENVAEAKKYFTEAYNTNTEAGLGAGVLLHRVAIVENNLQEAENVLVELVRRTNGEHDELNQITGEFYYSLGQNEKAYPYYKKLVEKYADALDERVILLAITENLGQKADAEKYYKEIKGLLPENTNERLGNFFAFLGEVNLSEKYLKKAITEDKDRNVIVQLARLYAITNRIPEAKAQAKEAMKFKVAGAAELLKQLEEIK